MAELRSLGAEAEGFLMPLQGPEDAPELCRRAARIDILVCAFGPFLRGPLETQTAGDWSRVTGLNLALPGALVSTCIGSMLERSWGRILLFGGTGTDAIRGFSTTAAYAAAKTGLGSLAKSVARVGGERNVTCNVLCPGFVDTEYVDEQERSWMLKRAGAARVLDSAEIAQTAYELLANSALNGAIIAVDAGLSL